MRPGTMAPRNQLRERRGFKRFDPLAHYILEDGPLWRSSRLKDGRVHSLFNMDEKQVGNEKGVTGNISASPSARLPYPRRCM